MLMFMKHYTLMLQYALIKKNVSLFLSHLSPAYSKFYVQMAEMSPISGFSDLTSSEKQCYFYWPLMIEQLPILLTI